MCTEKCESKHKMTVFRCEANFEYYCIAQYKPTFFYTETCCFIFLFLYIFISRVMRFGCMRPLPTVESRGLPTETGEPKIDLSRGMNPGVLNLGSPELQSSNSSWRPHHWIRQKSSWKGLATLQRTPTLHFVNSVEFLRQRLRVCKILFVTAGTLVNLSSLQPPI